jgi:hypothetical protein
MTSTTMPNRRGWRRDSPVPIQKGRSWGLPAPLPDDGIVVATDAEARAVVTDARRTDRRVPVLGLVGGDLCRTLGGGVDRARLRSSDAMTFSIDLGAVLVDGRLHWFVAHLVARSRWWGRALVAMNAQWYGEWNLGPRAHPNDGLLDIYDARLGLGDLLKVRGRVRQGAHLPHPRITERRVAGFQISLDRSLPIEVDGIGIGSARALSVRIEPDALTVVV